jgi:hypothetical protein
MIRKTKRQNKIAVGFTESFCVLIKSSDGIAASRTGAQNTPARRERLHKKEFIKFAKCKFHWLNKFDFISRKHSCLIKMRKNILFRIIVFSFGNFRFIRLRVKRAVQQIYE